MEKTFITLANHAVQRPYIGAVGADWVFFGSDNKFLEQAIETAQASPIQSAILNNKMKYIKGAGFEDTPLVQPNLYTTWGDLFAQCVTDYVYAGAFAISARLNEDGATYTFDHTPITQVRCGKSHNGIVDTYYLCANWTYATSLDNILTVKAFGSETPQKGETYLLYFKPYQPLQFYYALPEYTALLNWIKVDAALGVYYLNYVKNRFSADIVVTYPSEPDEEQKKALYEGLQQSYGGNESGNSILLLFGENGTVPTVQPLASTNAELYETLSERCTKELISGNRLTSPTLCGISSTVGFSSKAEEIIAAYDLYNLTVIDNDRQFLISKFNYLATLNNNRFQFHVLEYDIRKEFEGLTTENEEIEETVQGTSATDN